VDENNMVERLLAEIHKMSLKYKTPAN
jgi:hypothetical protein